jgi:hypothetical protein
VVYTSRSPIFFAGVTDERTKFYHVLSQLDQRFANEIADIIKVPSQHHSYTRLKDSSWQPRISHRRKIGITEQELLEESIL